MGVLVSAWLSLGYAKEGDGGGWQQVRTPKGEADLG